MVRIKLTILLVFVSCLAFGQGATPNLRAGLELYIKMESTSPIDQTGNHTPTNNGATSVTGKVGNALSFDGNNDYISIPDDAVFDFGGEFSISLWCKFVSEASYSSLLMHDESLYKYMVYRLSGTADLRFYVRTSTGTAFTAPDITVGDDSWHHILCTYDKNNTSSQRLKMYVDGVLEASAAGYDEDITDGDEGISIAKATSNYHKGLIDEVMLYNFALKEINAKQLYNSDSGLLFVQENFKNGKITFPEYLAYYLEYLKYNPS